MRESTPAADLAYTDDHWIAGTLPGLEIPGWMVLALRRHATDAAPLSEQEASSLGPSVRSLSTAIVEATGAERIYLQTYGETERHWHMLLSPRGPEVPPEHRHIALFEHRAEYLDPDRSRSVLAEITKLVRAKAPA